MSNSKKSQHDGKGATPARTAALEVVRRCRERDAFVRDTLASVVDQANLSPEDRAFAAKLAFGVVNYRGVLDELLDRALDSPDDITDDVRDALRLSTYEIIYLRKSSYAAVDQGVELVRSIAPRASGLANAVLRRVASEKDAFPFGDPSNSREVCARLYGFPLWLATKLISDLGSFEACVFMSTANREAPVFVAANALKASDDEVNTLLGEADADPQSVEILGEPIEGCFRLENNHALLNENVKQAFDEGKLLVCDAAAQTVVQHVCNAITDEPASAGFLEIGAGRATKTILLQSGMYRRYGAQINNYVVVDKHDFKIAVLQDRVKTYGAHVSQCIVGDATVLTDCVDESARFNVVFVDAPCSGLGTLRRHPEIRWRLTEDDILSCAATDKAILKSAAAYVAPEGLLAYSTCTITPEENAQVIQEFLASCEGQPFELIDTLDEKTFFHGTVQSLCIDCHYLALMRRKTCDEEGA